MKEKLIVNNEIYLKIVDENDVDAIFDTIDSERDYLGEWLPFVKYTQEQTDTVQFVDSLQRSPVKDLTFAIYAKGNFAGLIGLKDPDYDNKKVEIGYWLAYSYQHQGIITQSAKRLITFAFDDLGMNRIQLKAATENYKSQNVAKRLGFTFEGIERNGELHERGFVDLMQFGLLKKDF
jgi:ribosomal-protein-serine acetyltransferase